MSETNKYLLTIDDIFRMQGRQKGFTPSDFEYEQAQKTINDLNKSKLESMMSPELAVPKYVTLTNNADKSEVRGIMEGGKFREIPADKINTQQGMYSMSNPTNAVPIVDPNTRQQLQGYAAEANYGGAPAPMAGGGAFAGTNAPTPSPTPSLSVTAAQASQRFGTNISPGTYPLKQGGVLVVTP